MPKLPSIVIPAPRGMDSAARASLLPPDRAQRIENFRCDRAGKLRASLSLTDVFSLIPPADGVTMWYGQSAEEDQLLVVSGGLLYVGRRLDPESDPVRWDLNAIGGGFAVGKQVRAVSYEQETFFVQEEGIQPKRYDGVGLYQLGISPPAAAPVVLPVTPTVGPDNKSGTIEYTYSYFDRQLREGDLSPGQTINYNTYTGKAGGVYIDYGDDLQVYGAYIYATTSGAATRYRIATLYKHLAEQFHEDNLTDNQVSAAGSTQAPTLGKFAIPNPASVIEVHKRHLVINDTTNPKVLQINNIDNPTKWASATLSATDGARMVIGTHQGAGIVALCAIGTILMVGTRNETLQLWGETPIGNRAFELRMLDQSQGVLAPGTWKTCVNQVVGLMNDGKVWAQTPADQFIAHELSAQIAPDLERHTIDELERAVAAFGENTYLLSIGSKQYLYDFAQKGWTIGNFT